MELLAANPKSDRTDDAIVEKADRGQTVLRRSQEGSRPTGTRRRRHSAGGEVSCLASDDVAPLLLLAADTPLALLDCRESCE